MTVGGIPDTYHIDVQHLPKIQLGVDPITLTVNPVDVGIRLEKIPDVRGHLPADFSVGEYARGAFGIAGGKPEAVELVFASEMAGYIRERVWHESQSMEDRSDGSVALSLQVAPGWELKSWIKGFLPHVRVTKPAKLRDEIARELDAARRAFVPPRDKR